MLNQLYMWLTTLSQCLFYLRMMELSKKKWLIDSVCMDNPISGVLKINIHKLLGKNSFEKLPPDFPQLPLPCYLQTELSVSFCFSLALQMTPTPSFQLAFPPPEPLLVLVLSPSQQMLFWFSLWVGGSRFTGSPADCPVAFRLVWIPVALCILWRGSLQHSADAGAARVVQYNRLERCSVVELSQGPSLVSAHT